ncbi:MAG TPA: hypothetical protein VFX74_05115, partial [Candidatus Limnocylindria bacterium]|nr:hypothetical protein [Candidatus Limnocylindria bacterium]
DVASGAPVFESVQASGPYRWWGVRIVNGFAVFAFATATLITLETWSASNPGLGVQTTITAAKTVGTSSRPFDIMNKDATTISVAYSDGTNVQAFDYVPNAGAATFWTPKDSAAANIPAGNAMAWFQDFGASGKIALLTIENAHGLRAMWDIPTAGATRQAVSTYSLDPGAPSGTLAGFTTGNSATGQFVVLYDDGGTSTSTLIQAATREAGVITTGVFYRSVCLDSKPFVGTDGKYYVGAHYFSATQPTRFILRVPETITNFSTLTSVVAKTQVNDGFVNGFPTGPLCPVSALSGGEFVYSNAVQLRLPGNPTAYIPQGVGVDIIHIKFKSLPDATTSPPREGIDSLFTPGGIVGQFDGRTYCDAGFNYYPEQPAITPGGGGSLTTSSTYFYALVYRWVDANGRIWRSAPSIVKSVAMGANTSNTLSCPTYRLADRDDIAIEVYRGGANNSTTLQLVGAAVNDPTVNTVTFVDTASDTVQAGGEQLYTNGAAGSAPLAADGIPGSPFVTIAGQRAWIVSNDNPYEVWPSNQFIPGQGWRFSEQNKLIFNDSFGPVTGIAAQPSGVVVVFKATAYYLVSGDGPNQAGNGGSFTVSQPVVGVGTTNPRSVLETPSGIEFRMDAPVRAWYRVNTAQQAEYIGSPIERYTLLAQPNTPLPIVGAVLIPSTGETRYYTSTAHGDTPDVLIHDPISDTWSVDIKHDDLGSQTAACAYGSGGAAAINGAIWVDDLNNPGQDGATPFAVLVTTPWIKGADLDGYAMFSEARGVGETANGLPAPVTAIGLDADLDPTDVVIAESATPGPLWDWAFKYPSKLSSFRFAVTFNATATVVKMSAIIAEYGVKSGLAPASYTKRTQ